MSDDLSVAIVHYHLRPGGVTRVIEHACAALAERGVAAVVLAGEPPHASMASHLHVRVVEALAYDADRPPADPAWLAKRLTAAAAAALGRPPDLWHVHNHALGKNAALPPALRRLADNGRHLLLQLHDFAEDGRPGNYHHLLQHAGGGDPARLGRQLYPQAPHVHYAVINGRDLGYLRAAGVPQENAHLLANAASMSAPPPEADPPHRPGRLFLYPTRAIRRKNLGEFLLWSAVADEGDRFGVTRAPLNPDARSIYERWISAATRLRLPVEFELGERSGRPYVALLASAFALVTTSVAEGFGLVFLEPWLIGRPLVGRNLPRITAEIRDAGVDLSALYEWVGVPLEWIGRTALAERVHAAMARSCAAYGLTCGPAEVEAAMDDMVRGDHVDFGRLDEPMQEQVIARVRESKSDAAHLTPPRLVGAHAADAGRIARNRDAVRGQFSLEQYGRRLIAVYERVLASPTGPVTHIDAQRLLRQFMDPRRFSLLRT